MSWRGMVLTDLDGTFLDAKSKVSQGNIEALKLLGKQKIARVACTGRTLDSSREVLGYDLPFDYLIFSSGAGICSYGDDEVITHYEIAQEHILKIYNYFIDKDFDFSVHMPVPENHRFYWFASKNPTKDLDSRLYYLKEFATKGTLEDVKKLKSSTQFLAITKKGYETVQEMRKTFPELSIIRATSPLNPEYTWIEVFSKDVSKGEAAKWLCNHLNIEQKYTMSIGNDYNDLEMLRWTNESFAVTNSPAEIVEEFKEAPHHDEDGFAKTVYQWVKGLGMKEKTHRILTGEIGEGKTTALLKDFDNQQKAGKKVAGFACKKVMLEKSAQEKEHIGYDLVCFNTKESCPFIRKISHMPSNWNEEERIAQHFSFSKEGFEFARKLYKNAKSTGADHFYMDEAGYLELNGKGFASVIEDAIKNRIKLTIVVRKQLIDEFVANFKIKKHQIITIDEIT